MKASRPVFVVLFGALLLVGCNDGTNCDDCPIPGLVDACLEASENCDEFSGETLDECLAEARALCTTQPSSAE